MNSDCRSGVCDTRADTCVGCTSNADCAGATPICDVARRMCRPCSTSMASDCSGPTPACAASGQQRGALRAVHGPNAMACTGATPVCDTLVNACVGCVVSWMLARPA